MFDFVLSDVGECVKPSGGKDLDGGDAAEVAPMVAVLGGGDGGVVVTHVLSHD